jgi:hypothetical protein
MRSSTSTSLIAIPIVLWLGSFGAPDPPSKEVKKLIDELAEVSELGVGYSTLSSGVQFLPQADSEEIGALVLGSPPPRKSPALEKLVRQGAGAVPTLLEHLDDKRMTRIPPIKGMMWMWFIDHHDCNRRILKTRQPKSVRKK